VKRRGKNRRSTGSGLLFRAQTGSFVLAILCFLCFCRDPFFPHLGIPDSGSPLRATPMGVITQLINSYEQQRLDLFQDLFPAAGTFRFYVSPSFVSLYNSEAKYYVNPPEPRDTMLHSALISQGPSYYYYWTQEVEIQSHKGLLTQAQSIIFTIKPNVNPGDIRYIVNSTGDTTNVELLMTGGEIDAVFDLGGGTIDEEIISIENQVFLLERDAGNLWVIRKWYDFGSQP
jgi:hypothetical protein